MAAGAALCPASRRHARRRLFPCASSLFAFVLASSLIGVSPSRASDIPFERSFPVYPERYDSEYAIDILTMHFDREWRDGWYGADNIFAMRFGSLNVEQWNLEESLKFSAAVAKRWRVRYWMEMRHSLDERAGERNELELEFRVKGPMYLSLLLEPAFWKRETDAGMCLQHRLAVDRYVRLIFRVHDFANDFAYRHGEHIEGEENLYRVQPVEAVLDAREEIGSDVRFGFGGIVTNTWEKEYRKTDVETLLFAESAYRRDGALWLEYEIDPALLADVDMRFAELYDRYPEGQAVAGTHRVREFVTRVWWYPYARAAAKAPGSTPKEADDAAEDASDLVRRGGFGVCAGLEVRRERWSGWSAATSGFRKNETLLFLLFQRSFGGRHMLEWGYLADQYRSHGEAPQGLIDDRWENRLKLAYEVRFRRTGRCRIIETIDLDREDWGQFSIHDHFFLMLLLDF